MAEMIFAPVPNQEAIDYIQSLPAVEREVFEAMLPELKAYAFTITGIEDANTLQRIRDLIAKLPAGSNWDDVKREIADQISPWLDPEEAERRAELLLRTHGFRAYQAGQYNIMQRQKDVFPYWMYQTAGDDRVRPAHEALDKMVLPANDPFWQDHYPPWDWGCRCQVVPLSEFDVQEIRDREQDLPPEEQTVLEGAVLDRLRSQDKITTTIPMRDSDGNIVWENEAEGIPKYAVRDVSVASPTKSGDPNPFYWNPGDLRIPVEELRLRYEPEVFAMFEAQMKQAKLDDGRSVWDWLNERLQPPAEPPAPALSRDTLRTIENVFADKSDENMIVLDETGRQLLSKVGDVSGLTLNDEDLLRMQGAVVTHNHPTGTPFSPADLETFYLSGASELRAITKDAVYVLRQPASAGQSLDERKTLRDSTIGPAIQSTWDREWDALAADFFLGKITFDERRQRALERTAQLVAEQMGWTYTRESR